ncbi:MAG TPA: response regulator transcription factor [Ktedonobacterales bacterium]
MRILVVDDDPIGSRMLHFLLTEEGYIVDAVDGPRGALAMVEKHPPDLVLLDVNMPQTNGFELYKRLIDQEYDIPVIFVTAKGELDERLHGLKMGADDYITKPFQPAELLARVEAVLRRYRKAAPGGVQVVRGGGFEIYVSELRVTLPDGRNIYLTPTELRVLIALVQRVGQVVSRDELLANAWSDHQDGETNVVDVYIRRLRRKIERDPSNPVHIQSARGLGYKLTGK